MYYRMLQESILPYLRPSLSYHMSLKSLFLSTFEWPLKTGFTVYLYQCEKLIFVMKILQVQRKSRDVELMFFHIIRDCSYRKECVLFPILKSDAVDEIYCLSQLSSLDFSFLAPLLLTSQGNIQIKFKDH